MLKKTLCLVAFAATLLPGAAPGARPLSDVIVEHNVAMKTRDGVTLYADVYRPAGEGASRAAERGPRTIRAAMRTLGVRRRCAATWW